MPDKDNFGAVLQPAVYAWQNNDLGLKQDDVTAALRSSAGTSGFHEMNHPVVVQPFTKAKRAQSVTDDETWVDGQVNPTLSLFDQGDTRATTVAVVATVDMQACKGNANVGDGSVSPTLCKPSGNDVHAVVVGTDLYNGAITGDVAATMGTPGSSVNASGPTVMQAVAFKPGQSASAHSIGAQEGVACTLEAGGGGNNKQAVAFDWQSGGDSRGLDPKDTAQLQRCQTPAVAHVKTLQQQGYDAFYASTQETNAVATLRTLRSQIGEEAFAAWGLGILDSLQPQEVLRSRLHGIGVRCATFSRSWPIDCAISREEDRAAWAMQSVREAKGEGCPSLGWQLSQQLTTELGAYLSELPRPGAQTERFVRDLWLAGEGIGFLREALSAFQEARRPPRREGQPALHAMQVRRLTATECEFLQGFPRNWTAIPWRGKPAEQCPDGPRYKALGNSMACNCMAWIGERIHAYEQTGRVAPAAAEAELMERGGSGTNEGGA